MTAAKLGKRRVWTSATALAAAAVKVGFRPDLRHPGRMERT
jgi:hypothetical protein